MRKFVLLACAAMMLVSSCRAQELTIAAAADLQFALAKIATDFQKETGIAVKVTYGSSGNLTTQIQNGAPFDLFFSADVEYPKRLIQAGAADGNSLYEYATGKLVLWVPNGSKLDINKGLKVLTDPAIAKIAIANPIHAPYGRAAVEAMKSAQVYDTVSSKLVVGENISQAAQYVETGNADVGLLALALAASPSMKEKGRYFAIAENAYTPIHQAAVIVSSSKHKEDAVKFIEYMKKPETLAIMQSYGFTVPGKR
jgi:molybdate transport system substrate-binding protein